MGTTEAIQTTRIIMLNESQEDLASFVPSEAGEICAIFLTNEERNLLAKLLVLQTLTNEGEKALARGLYLKLPNRR